MGGVTKAGVGGPQEECVGPPGPSPALTLQLGALVALVLAPGGADAPAAVLLLGEAWQGVAATLEGKGGMDRVTGRLAPPTFLLRLFPSLLTPQTPQF